MPSLRLGPGGKVRRTARWRGWGAGRGGVCLSAFLARGFLAAAFLADGFFALFFLAPGARFFARPEAAFFAGLFLRLAMVRHAREAQSLRQDASFALAARA